MWLEGARRRERSRRGHRDNGEQIMWVLRDPCKDSGFHSEWDEQPLQGLTKE